MIEQRFDEDLRTYRLARTGFLFLAIGLVPTAVTTVLSIFGQFGDPRILFLLRETPAVHWIPTLTNWSLLIGVTLLWGRWDNSSWQRRTSLLMIMSLVDVGIWFLDLGDPQRIGDSAWFRERVGNALGWAEFALLAGLSGDFLTHLGVEQAEESAKSTRSLAATGAMIWLIVFCESADFRNGWPIKPNPWIARQTLLLGFGADLIWAICLIQVTALVVAAVRQSNSQVRELEADSPVDDLFAPPGDPGRKPDPASRDGDWRP